MRWSKVRHSGLGDFPICSYRVFSDCLLCERFGSPFVGSLCLLFELSS